MKPISNSGTNVVYVKHTSSSAESGFVTSSAREAAPHPRVVVWDVLKVVHHQHLVGRVACGGTSLLN